MRSKFTPLVPVVVMTMLVAGAVQTALSGEPETAGTAASAGVFHGEVEISIVTLYATVVDRKGHPVSGLKADDFAVFESGEAREITFFEAIDQVGPALKGHAAQTQDERKPVKKALPGGDSVAVVFDNVRLERRNRRRVLKALKKIVDPLRRQGVDFMVGVLAPRFQVIEPFGDDPERIAAAFDRVGDTPTMGGALKGRQRDLKRDVYGGLKTANARSIQAMAQAEGLRLGFRIDAYREAETQRALAGLNRLEALVRSLADRGGRTALIWVTEDMNFRPGIGIYRRYFNRFSTFLTLDPPDLWGTERNLQMDFDRVISAAFAAGVTVHVVDASDRDRDFMDTDFGAQDRYTSTASMAAGDGTRAYDFFEVSDAIEGAQYLGYGSGGGFFGNSRNFDAFAKSFVETVSTYYVIGYDHPKAVDGRARSLRLEVKRPGLRIRYPEKILERTPEQQLTDSVVAQLVWGEGINTLGFRVRSDTAENSEDNILLRPVHLEIPATGLLLGDDGKGIITVVMCVGASDGTIVEPYQFRLILPVPKDNPLAVGTADVTLRTRQNADRIAVGIRDELSGATSTILVNLSADPGETEVN